MDTKKKKVVVSSVLYAVIAVIIAICITGTVFARRYNRNITAFLCGSGIDVPTGEGEYSSKLGDDLAKAAGEDSMVLLRNENDALPLENGAKINVFGAASADQNWKVTGIGSGTGVIKPEDKHTLMRSLKDAGFKVNEALENYYAGLKEVLKDGNYNLAEPDTLNVKQVVTSSNATQFSDTAIVVFGRNAGETIPEIPLKQSAGNRDNSKTYLELTDQEEALLKYLKTDANFAKIIVIVNAANAMNLDFVEMPEYGIDACLYAGFTGQSGAHAIGKILKGEINPSGRTSDTYVFAATNHKYDPTWVNNRNVNVNSNVQTQNMVEAENIYYGYKWYETADAEGYFSKAGNKFGKGYDAVVQYPFGYGLDYTDFEWKVKSVSPARNSKLALNTEISITVEVKNTGSKAGKDVVELYANPPYTSGGIEKSAVNLVAFEKTPLIEPKGTAEVTLKVSAFELASFDCWDLNGNGKTSWELDEGDYELTLRTDAHTVADDVMASGNNATFTYKADSTLVYDKDPVGGGEIDTRLTGDEAYAGVSVDGTNVGLTKGSYLSRADSFKNFADTCTARTEGPDRNHEKMKAARVYLNPTYETETMPTTGSTATDHRIVTVEGGGKATADQLKGKDTSVKLEYNKELIKELAADFDGAKWEEIVKQMTVSELKNLFHFAGFQTYEAESVGKLKNVDYDGPAGFNLTALKGAWEGGSAAAEKIEELWTVWPSESLLGCSWNKNLLLEIGLFMGMEAANSKVSGWYAPGMNLHRTAYTNRNFEYYSEDAVLTGYLAANVVHGAKMNNLYCYMKHFVVCEYGANPTDVDTWLTEQSLRENPMRAFEIAVKKGGGNAIMTSFNNVGPVWSGANYATCTQILRNEWGFKGTLLTDICSLASAYGLGKFSHTQGLRSGQDIWLNNSVTMFDDIDDKDPTMIAAAQRAAKNVLWTGVDTYNYASTYDRTQLDAIFGDTGETSQKYAIDLSVRIAPAVFAWWIPVAISVEVLVLAGCAVWAVFITLGLLKALKSAPAQTVKEEAEE